MTATFPSPSSWSSATVAAEGVAGAVGSAVANERREEVDPDGLMPPFVLFLMKGEGGKSSSIVYKLSRAVNGS